MNIRNSESPSPSPRRRGRPPGPKRCVVQLRVREGGKVLPFYSVTIAAQPSHIMKALQELAETYKPAKVEPVVKVDRHGKAGDDRGPELFYAKWKARGPQEKGADQ